MTDMESDPNPGLSHSCPFTQTKDQIQNRFGLLSIQTTMCPKSGPLFIRAKKVCVAGNTYPSTDEWTDMIYPNNGTLFSHEKETLTHATMWIQDLKNMMRIERSQSQRTRYCMFPITVNIQNGKICRDGK